MGEPWGAVGTPCQPLMPHLVSRLFQAHMFLQLKSQHLLCLELGWGPAGHVLQDPRSAGETVSVGLTSKTATSQEGGGGSYNHRCFRSWDSYW